MAVPNIFGSATAAIPLSQLDQNFATAITLGNTAVYLGNTTTSLGNVTLTNVTISSGNVSVSTATVGAGSNTAPSITTTGDTNTGIFFPAADQVAITTGGTQRAVVDASGNVGIGTSSPSAKVQIGDATVATSNRIVFGKAIASSESFLPAIGQQSSSGVGNDLALAVTSTSGVVRFYTGPSTNSGEIGTGSNTEKMRLDSSGNLGLGVTPSASTLATFESEYGLISGKDEVNIIQSAYYGSGGFIYSKTEAAGRYLINSGIHSWFTAPSGTAGDAISFTQAMTLDASGNLGIGTSSPSSLRLTLEGNGNQLRLRNSTTRYRSDLAVNNVGVAEWNCFDDSGGVYMPMNLAGSVITFGTGSGSAPERMRIDSSGNVGIGTSSPAVGVHLNRASGNTYYRAQNNLTSTDFGVDSAGNGILWNNGNYPLAFGTNNLERARIDTSGNLLIGYTSSNGSYKLQVNSQIFATNATIATSDGRYKENIQSLDGALNLVSQLNPVQFSWKEHPVHNFDLSGPTIGFIAQEVEQVLADKPYLNSIIKRNECVIEPEEKDAEGNVTKEAVTEEFLGIAEGNMIALLTKALQELKADFDAYKASHP